MKKFLYVAFCLVNIFLNNFAFAEEYTKKKLKFFNLDLHIGVIGDIKNIFESLGHEVESKSISNHTWVFGKPKDDVKVISQENWLDLNPDMVERFYQEFKDYLSNFDGFIVTHAASFALLYEKFNKPIIIVNSTRYTNKLIKDSKKLKWLNDYLKTGILKNKIFIISNNKGDQNYLKYYTGIESELIPSLCLYTNAKYTGNNKGFITKDRLKLNIDKIFKHPDLIQNKKLPNHYKWQELYDFQGIIHFPYQISTMSIFEQYSANVPLFFPTKNFLLRLHREYPKKILSELSFFQITRKRSPNEKNNPDNIKDNDQLNKWIDYADYYDEKNMPYIQYFNSFADLEYLLLNSNLKLISKKMEQYNQKRKAEIFKKWEEILNKVERSL